jgi:hypothetical protein
MFIVLRAPTSNGYIILSGFPRTPKLLKGALISFEPSNPEPQVIAFQYNPDSMSRSLQGQGGGAAAAGSSLEAFRIKGPPIETINLDIEIDASEKKLEQPEENARTAESGILPELSSLEILLYPQSQHIASIMNAASSGVLEVVPPEGPFTLFVWGPKRILPVHLTKFEIVEEAYDTNLNPIRAKVSLGLRVLSYLDISQDHPAYGLYSSHHIAKEALARMVATSDLSAVGVERSKLS